MSWTINTTGRAPDVIEAIDRQAKGPLECLLDETEKSSLKMAVDLMKTVVGSYDPNVKLDLHSGGHVGINPKVQYFRIDIHPSVA